MFSIYIGDVTTGIRNSTCHADNLKIYMIHFKVTGMRVPITVTVMNTEVEAISSWAFEHSLKLNKNRTQTVVIGHPKFLKMWDSTITH